MFGLVKGGCSLQKREKEQWMSHICGVCISLGNQFGQPSRIATNYDAALISVLCEAQSEQTAARVEHLCPLRGMRRASVVTTANIGSEYASAIALKSAATKLEDHHLDKEGIAKYLPTLSKHLFDKWHDWSNQALNKLNLDPQKITQQITQQAVVESKRGRLFTYYSEPTELAVASAFAHTAVLTHQPANRPFLFEIGRMYGRIMFLVDSFQDRVDDLKAGRFNALAQSYTPEKVQTVAQQLFQNAHTTLKLNCQRLNLLQPTLVTHLLIDQLAHIGYHTFSPNANSYSHCSTNQSKRKKRNLDYWFDCCCYCPSESICECACCMCCECLDCA